MVWKQALFLAGVLAVVTVGSAAADDDVAYLGNTTARIAGNAGVVKFQQLCDAAFPGMNARICTSEEIIRNAGGVPKADTDSNFQWVHPSIVLTAGTQVVDFSGFQATTAANLSCNGWSSNASTVTGLLISNLGLFRLGFCNGNNEITCCAAVPVP